MAQKNQESKSVSSKITQILNQARESLRILRNLENETLLKAKKLVKIPKSTERKKLKNDRILSSLKKVGVATRADLLELYEKVQMLEDSLQSKTHSSRKSRQKLEKNTTSKKELI